MKTIGLIGGMSWQSTKYYYHYLNELVAQRLGGLSSAKLLMSSINFHEINQCFAKGDWEQIGRMVSTEAKRLEDAGADAIVLATNTIHKVSNEIEAVLSIHFLHIARVTGNAIVKQGLQKIALLGTQFTMGEDFYTKILQDEYQLEVLVPKVQEQELLQTIIFDELVKGVFTEDARQACMQIIGRLRGKGAEGVILGCTELPMLLPSGTLEMPSFDTTMLHSEAAVDFALQSV